MALLILLLLPLAGALLAWPAQRLGPHYPRRIALFATSVLFATGVGLWFEYAAGQGWFMQLHTAWVPRFGIGFHLGLDGLSLLLVLLTALLGIMAALASRHVVERSGFYFFNLLLTLTGIVGIFLALDLFLFFFFWEAMLVPMYFLIALWGHERRLYAATKFFLFTQASGLLMLVAILALVLVVYGHTRVLTFDYLQLLQLAPGAGTAQRLLMLGFFVAFAVKLPVVPLHTWLPEAHTQAPTAASVLLAGIMLKTGAYGLMRFVLPLFPEAAREAAPLAMALGVLGILYGAFAAIAQHDIKRLIAYSSVSHMGFVLLGAFAGTPVAYQGAVIQLIAHGLGIGALFMLAGSLQERIGSRNLAAMGGLWTELPRIASLGLFFAVAALGLPGLGGFTAEFLVLLGSWRASPLAASIAALGLVVAAVYALMLVQKAFHGPPAATAHTLHDYGLGEVAALASLAVALIALGLYPQPVIETIPAPATGLASVQDRGAP